MNPLRKQFAAETVFPFEMVYRDKKLPQQELPDHQHAWSEIVYVHAGTGTFFIDRFFYEMRQGDLFLIPGDTIHRAFPNREHPVTSTAVFFDAKLIHYYDIGDGAPLHQCMDFAVAQRSYKLSLPDDEQPAIERLLSEIQREKQQKAAGARTAQLLHLHLMLLLVNRRIGTEEMITPDNTAAPAWLMHTIRHIDQHLQDDLRLSSLSSLAAVSPSHFCRVFKQHTGLTPTDYVNAKRVLMAKEKLANSPDNITDVAAKCGFESPSYFHKLFKRHTGKTPLAYRRRVME